MCPCRQTIPDVNVKGQGGFPDPLSEGIPPPPWPDPGYTRRPGQGKQPYPIRGGGGGSGTTPTPA